MGVSVGERERDGGKERGGVFGLCVRMCERVREKVYVCVCVNEL